MKSQPYAELQQDEAEASNSAISFRGRGEDSRLMKLQHWKLTLLLLITSISLIINIIVFTKVATRSKSCSGSLLSQTAFFPHCEYLTVSKTCDLTNNSFVPTETLILASIDNPFYGNDSAADEAWNSMVPSINFLSYLEETAETT